MPKSKIKIGDLVQLVSDAPLPWVEKDGVYLVREVLDNGDRLELMVGSNKQQYLSFHFEKVRIKNKITFSLFSLVGVSIVAFISGVIIGARLAGAEIVIKKD